LQLFSDCRRQRKFEQRLLKNGENVMVSNDSASNDLQEKLLDYIQDAHSLEHNVLNMLDSMIANTKDPQTLNLLKQHRSETVVHEQRLAQRLDELGKAKSMMGEATAAVSSWFKSMGNAMRTDKPGKNARDGYVTEHVEIAAYELLERLAMRAGDTRTAEIARLNKKDEYEMARRLGDNWDRAIDLTLLEAGIDRDNSGTQTGSFGERTDAAERGSTWTGSSAEADMGLGVHGNRSATNTGYDQVQGNVPSTGDIGADVRSSTPRTRNP
jgi:ferritin-like metal-binding protein YciE